MIWYLDCFLESQLIFAVNSYSYDKLEKAILAANNVLIHNNITGIYAVDIYSDDTKKRRFYNAEELKKFLTYL